MAEALTIVVGMVLVNNIVLTTFLGSCPLLGASRRLDSAIAMALATAFVLILTSLLTWLIDRLVLVPLSLASLRLIAFMVVIAAVVQLTDAAVRRISPLMHQVFGLYMPLIAGNCAVLGVALLNAEASASLGVALFSGLAAAAGFSLVLVLFAAARERLEVADVPHAFRGAGIGLVTAGLMTLAFMGFAGMGTG